MSRRKRRREPEMRGPLEAAKPQEELPEFRRMHLPSLLVAQIEAVKAFSGMNPGALVRFWMKTYTEDLCAIANGLEKITRCPAGPTKELEFDLTAYQSKLLDLAACAHGCSEADVVYTLCQKGFKTIPERFWAKVCN